MTFHRLIRRLTPKTDLYYIRSTADPKIYLHFDKHTSLGPQYIAKEGTTGAALWQKEAGQLLVDYLKKTGIPNVELVRAEPEQPNNN